MNYLFFILFMLFNYSCNSSDSPPGPPEETYGCTNQSSCNYNSEATVDDQSCWDENIGCVCADGEGSILDCNDICGGTASIDNCGVCSGGDTGSSVNQCGIITDGCSLPLNRIGFVPKKDNEEWGSIIYNVDSPIGGFQFNINNVQYTPHSQLGLFYGGEASFEQFAISYTNPGSPILAFNLLGNIISESCGVLTNISYENNFTSNSDQVYIDSIVFSNHNGIEIDIMFFDTCTNDSYDCNGMCSGQAYIDACSNCTEGTTGEDDCLDGYIDCFGSIGIDADVDVTLDCFNTCGGSAVEDCAGVCDGTAIEDCNGVCAGTGVEDCAGVCDGTAVEDCAGVCGGQSINDCNGTCGGASVEDCLGVCNGGTVLDGCGVCNGDGTSCQLGACDIDPNTIYLHWVDDFNYNVFYNTTATIGGFQFVVDGANATNASGGDAQIAGFTVQVSGSTVLGFSFTGGTLPGGCGILTNLELSDTSLLLSNIVFSDPFGVAVVPNIIYHTND